MNEIFSTIDLKMWFKRQKITQRNIAERLNLTQGTVSAYLNGKPFGAKTAHAWSKEFGLNESWLLHGEGSMLKDSRITQTISGNENNVAGLGSVNTGVPANLHEKALNEIAEQRKLAERSQTQIDRLLDIIEHMQKTNKK